MKQTAQKIAFLMFTFFALTACGNTAQVGSDSTAVEDTAALSGEASQDSILVSISIQEDGEDIPGAAKELTVEKGTSLLEIMQESYEIVEEDGMITSIEGYEQVENEKYWMYFVNGEMANEGAADYMPENGDEVKWTLDEF